MATSSKLCFTVSNLEVHWHLSLIPALCGMPACQKLPAWFGDSVTRDDDSVSCVRSPPPTASDRQSLPPPRQVVVVDFSDSCLSRIHCSLRRTGSQLKSSTQLSTGVTQSKSYNGYPDVQTLVSLQCSNQSTFTYLPSFFTIIFCVQLRERM